MLQRQIMFKQLQELQRRQQLQELGDARNQDYINQLLTLKQGSGIQFAPIVNGAPVHDSQMIQQSGSNIFPCSPNRMVISQSHNHALGPMAMSMPQCDVSLYGDMASNLDKGLNLHPRLQGPYSHSANMLTMNGNNVSGMPSIHPLGVDSSFVNHQGNCFSEQIGMPGDSLLTNQAFQEKNLFGQARVHNLNRDLLSANYPHQGISLQRSTLVLESGERFGDTCSHGSPPGQISKLSQKNDSLDPLEQKILYNTDDHSWVSSVGSRKIATLSFVSTVENPAYIDTSPSIQSGSWSALMQSAVAETSSSDTAMQEEWSGLSFQNPEPSTDNQHLNFISTDIPQNNWIDRNMQNVSSPCSDPEPLFQKSNKNYSFPEFNHYGLQILKQKDEFQSESSHVSSQFSPRNTRNLVQTALPSPDTWPAQCHELRGPTWHHGSTPDSVVAGIQESFNQVNKINVQRYSVESMALGNNAHSSDLLGGSSDVQGENLTTQSENMLALLNKDDISNDHASGIQLNSKVLSLNELPLTDASAEYFAEPSDNSAFSQGFGFKLGLGFAGAPDSHSFSPSLSMGSSCMTSVPNDYNQLHAPVKSSCLATRFPGYTCASSQDTVSGNLVNNSGTPNMQLNQTYLKQGHNLQEFGTYSGTSGYCEQKLRKESSIHEGWPHLRVPESRCRSAYIVGPLRNDLETDGAVSSLMTAGTSQQLCNQAEQKDDETPGHFSHQNLPSRSSEAVCSKRLPLKYDNINSPQSIASARDVGLDGQKLLLNDKAKYDLEALLSGTPPVNMKEWNFPHEAQGNQSGRAVSASPQDFLQVEKLSQSGAYTSPTRSNEASNATDQSQISLQMAPSWFKHYGTLKNGPMLPTYNAKAGDTSAQPFSQLSIGSIQGHSFVMQLNSSNANQGSGSWPSSAAALMVNKNLPPPTDVTNHNLAVVLSKKRKLATFDMSPWHREVNCDSPKLQSISMAELEWSQVSNRKQGEAGNDAEILEGVPSVVRSKRRLTFTTQLMQKVFRPAPASFLTDASSNCDGLAYLAARLELGDACNLTNKPNASPDDLTPDKRETSKKSASNFSKVAEALISRVKKFEGDHLRLDRHLSLVDIKVESQDLEKFATINRFAKFHFRANLGTVEPTSSAGQSALQKAIPQRYVTGIPMPETLPDVVDCLSL